MESGADDVTERIKRAALRRFAEVGYGSATVDDIAATAGVGVATLYRRWPDKAALANTLMAEHLDDMDRLFQPLQATTPKRRFVEMWRRLWDIATADPDRFAFGEGHAHASFVSAEIAARKAAFAQSGAAIRDQVGIGATSETAQAMLFGTLTAVTRGALDVDPTDLGERLWAALRSAP